MLSNIFLISIIITVFITIKCELKCVSKFELYAGSLLYSSVYDQISECERCATFKGYIKGEKELKGQYSGCLDQLEWILKDYMGRNPFKIHGICGLSGRGYSLVNEAYEFEEYNVTTTCTPEKMDDDKIVEISNRESGPIQAAMVSNNITGKRNITIYMVLSSIFQIIISLCFTTS